MHVISFIILTVHPKLTPAMSLNLTQGLFHLCQQNCWMWRAAVQHQTSAFLQVQDVESSSAFSRCHLQIRIPAGRIWDREQKQLGWYSGCLQWIQAHLASFSYFIFCSFLKCQYVGILKWRSGQCTFKKPFNESGLARECHIWLPTQVHCSTFKGF